MGIETLGKSLLSSAKKKAKKGQQLGQLAGLAMVGMSVANSAIRRKAMDRHNAFQTSLIPVKKALDQNLLESGRVEIEYKNRSAHAGGELQSFIDNKFEMLKKAGGTVPSGEPQPSDQEYLAIAKKEAMPEFEEYRSRVEAYQDMFGIKDDDYYKQYNKLDKLTSAELKNDNLMELLGNKTGWGKNTSQVATEIMLANGASATLNVPANILAQFDTKYFDKLSAMAQRTAETQKVRKERLLSLSEQAKTRDSKVLLELVTPKPLSAVKIDEKINTAWDTISKVSVKVAGVDVINKDYIGRLKFVDKQFEDEYTVAELLDELAKINSKTQQPIKDTEIDAISNEDVLINTAKEYAQFQKTKFMATGSGVVDDIMYKGWMKEGFQKALAGVVVEELNVPYWFDKKIIKLKYEQDTPDDTPPEVPAPILMLRNRIAEYQDNPMGPPSGVLKDIQRMVEEFPDYKDEFSVYLEDMTRVDGTEKSSTGFKGPITNNVDNSTMTEVSIGVMIDGKETLVPAINELTTDAQVEVLQNLKIGVDPIPEDIQITAKKAAEQRIEAGLNPFYQDGEEEETDTTTPTKTPVKSLLSSTVPTQEELVQEFEMLGTENMSPAEIDGRLNDMINRKADFTTDEYIRLITYLNSKQGINPASSNTSLLEPTKELTDSEIIANALKGSGTGRNPAEVIRDMNTRNSIRNTNLGLKILERETSTARQAVATSGLLRNKDFVEFLESEGTTKEEFNTTTKDYVLNIFNKYLKQLQSK
jgi:hypothetical protein